MWHIWIGRIYGDRSTQSFLIIYGQSSKAEIGTLKRWSKWVYLKTPFILTTLFQ